MATTGLVVFLVTYAGIALGRIPGLVADRTGIAVLGATAMLVAGVLPLPAAMATVDVSTIVLLYALMVLSAQLRLGGFYAWIAGRIAAARRGPAGLLLLVMTAAASLSALLANDIVCLAFTPVLIVGLRRRGLSPLPFLLGLAVASNLGSAATILGNPQNMLIGQRARLEFGAFLVHCAPPTLAALAASYGLIVWRFRGRFARAAAGGETPGASAPIDRWQTGKGLFLTAALVGLFFTDVPREIAALGIAGVLLCSRRLGTRSILGLIDWHLLTLFLGLFVVVGALEATGWPGRMVSGLASGGVRMDDPYALSAVALLLGNLVSNVPAVMLLSSFIEGAPAPTWYALALASTFAGNLVTVGSIANLIVIEQARGMGERISFLDHARTGVPVTLVSFAVLLAWIALTG